MIKMKNSRLIYILIVILAIWLAVVTSNFNRASKNENQNIINEYNVTGFSTDFTRIADEVKPCMVAINADGNILSGFIYKQDGDDVYVVTAYHGVASAININVYFASSYTVEGELYNYDIYTDIAVIKVNTPYEMQTLTIGDSNTLKAGEFIISMGTPTSLDYAFSVELGMISHENLFIENTISVEEDRISYYLNALELSSNLQYGYSGSPVINMNGEFVGMNTMNLNLSSTFSFAITSNEIKIVVDKIINGEEINRNNIGIRGEFVSDMYNYEKSNLNIPIDTIEGLYVSKEKENSLAFSAGIRSGDIIQKINGIEINNFNDYLDALYSEVTDDFIFEYIHNGELVVAGAIYD